MTDHPLRILFLSSEVVPYAKTGGLADVAGALPAYLRAAGHDVMTVMPGYHSIDRDGFEARPGWSGVVGTGASSHAWAAVEDPRTATALIDIEGLYDRPALYTNDPDEHVRFASFAAAALELAVARGWRPDVVHCNDWQTALVPALLRGPLRANPTVSGAVTVLTIHNLGYQGRFGSEAITSLGLAEHAELVHQPHLEEGYLSFLETGIVHADVVTTVSPTYAREIRTPEGGAGLDSLLRDRGPDVVGILNGIDTDVWNPRTDPLIPSRYSAKSLWRKEKNKEALLARMGLGYRRHVPVVGLITRLAHQKGIDLLPGPFRHFLETWDMRIVVLGAGEPGYRTMLRGLEAEYPDNLAFVDGYDETLSHLIEAGSDIFVMPSLYEPCGLNQMYSLAYGTIPVVRRVGGLADTVEQADPDTGTGTGVLFDHYDEEGLGWALGRALTIHLDRKTRQRVQVNGMAVDNSWQDRAARYEQLYRETLEERRGRRDADDTRAGSREADRAGMASADTKWEEGRSADLRPGTTRRGR